MPNNRSFLRVLAAVVLALARGRAQEPAPGRWHRLYDRRLGHAVPLHRLTNAHVFISYAPNTSASNDTIGVVKFTGTSNAAVTAEEVKHSIGGREEASSMLTIKSKGDKVNATEALLIEFQLYRKHFVRSLSAHGYGEVVVLENVLYAGNASKPLDDLYLGTKFGEVSLFVVDPLATITANHTSIKAEFNLQNSGLIQVEVGRFNSSVPVGVQLSGRRHNISLFVDELHDVVKKFNDEPSMISTFCVTSKTSVNMTSISLRDKTDTAISSIVPAGSPCDKTPIPERVPRLLNVAAARAATSKPPPAAASASACRPSAVVALALMALGFTVMA